MRRGIWHQFGAQSQTLARDLLNEGVGVGVVVSPRDLRLDTAAERANEFRALGADVVLDPQFHIPKYTNEPLATYGLEQFRQSIGTLGQLPSPEYGRLTERLEEINRRLGVSAVIAPAVVYEAGRRDVQRLNFRLFEAARRAARRLELPVYSTIVLGDSVLASEETLARALGAATSHDCEGFYVAGEFREDRVPSGTSLVKRYLEAMLTIAMAGHPVMHAYAGPMALLSFGAGARAAAIGHRYNLWKFDRSRWGPTPSQQGGPTEYPPRRLFSEALWGTIVYPDETAQLPSELRDKICTRSPFSGPVHSGADWRPGDSWRHLVCVIGDRGTRVADAGSAKECALSAIAVLEAAVVCQTEVRSHVSLRDGSDAYQAPWCEALRALLETQGTDYDFLELLT